ncbi:MAG: small basic protein [Candidatus Brocadiaceae bacterium]|jgi:small basic protein (TIGR04137 family)
MSLHKSLKSRNRLVRRRNVLTRAERIERLEEDELWEEGEDSVFALPKVEPKILIAVPRAVEEPEEPEEEEAVQEGEGEESAAAASEDEQ